MLQNSQILFSNTSTLIDRKYLFFYELFFKAFKRLQSNLSIKGHTLTYPDEIVFLLRFL